MTKIKLQLKHQQQSKMFLAFSAWKRTLSPSSIKQLKILDKLEEKYLQKRRVKTQAAHLILIQILKLMLKISSIKRSISPKARFLIPQRLRHYQKIHLLKYFKALPIYSQIRKRKRRSRRSKMTQLILLSRPKIHKDREMRIEKLTLWKMTTAKIWNNSNLHILSSSQWRLKNLQLTIKIKAKECCHFKW